MRYVGEHGLATLTLRPLAAALGTSDRMLVYYSGSREGLVVALLDRAFADLAVVWRGQQVTKPSDLVRALWQALAEPGARVAVRLNLEAASLAEVDELWRERLVPATSSYLRTAEQWLVGAVRPGTWPGTGSGSRRGRRQPVRSCGGALVGGVVGADGPPFAGFEAGGFLDVGDFFVAVGGADAGLRDVLR
ncbi:MULTISPECIES: TetR/AcrR family transcriptional regulator [Streptomyces]|uniref:TetR/AcrR family transcriptional regulator n=1 Tax=Streptomyces TaxID=1883 RepID=UPI00345C5C07